MRNSQMLDKKSLNDRSSQVVFAPGNKSFVPGGKAKFFPGGKAFPGEAGNDFLIEGYPPG
jgi:hypothetical protein